MYEYLNGIFISDKYKRVRARIFVLAPSTYVTSENVPVLTDVTTCMVILWEYLSCLESPVLHFNNVKVRCVGKDEYVYDSYVRNIVV